MAAPASFTLSLLIDKEKNRVVFAESNSRFVQYLFGILPLPVGAVISGTGSMDGLLQSIESLEYLQFNAYDLQLDGNDLPVCYRCPDWDCFTKTHRLFSHFCGRRCPCGRAMDSCFNWGEVEADEEQWSIKDEGRFIISDDLHVFPVSMGDTLSWLEKLGIRDPGSLAFQRRTVDLTSDQIPGMVRRSLLSKTPLTDLFLPAASPVPRESMASRLFSCLTLCLGPIVKSAWSNRSAVTRNGSSSSPSMDAFLQNPDGWVYSDDEDPKTTHTSENDGEAETKRISLKLFERSDLDEVLYAEAGEDFVELLVCFLSLPLGSVVKLLLNKNASIGCIGHLYESVEDSSCENGGLLAPKVGFGEGHRLIKIDEKLPCKCRVTGCQACFNQCYNECCHGEEDVTVTEINPKLGNPTTEQKFMVTDGMVVTPLSHMSVIAALEELNVHSISTVVEREVTLGEEEALDLLRACLISGKALSTVFSTKKWKSMSPKPSEAVKLA